MGSDIRVGFLNYLKYESPVRESSRRDEKGSVTFCSFVLMCVLRFGFVLFWRAGYGFIDANVNLLFVLCNNLYDNFLKRSDNTRRRKNRRRALKSEPSLFSGKVSAVCRSVFFRARFGLF